MPRPGLSPYPGWYSGDNARLFRLMSVFLNLAADYIEPDMIDGITGGDGSMTEFAYAQIAAAACGLDVAGDSGDRRFFRERFAGMFKRLDTSAFTSDPYYRNIRLPEGTLSGGRFSFGMKTCRAYEAFVRDDPEIVRGRGGELLVTPRIGFFTEDYPYPAVFENGREWMTLMPNETVTSSFALKRAHGRVLTYGLGLGYFAYMASEKPSVASVTVVERSPEGIALFREHILPQFGNRDKIELIESDAFDYAEHRAPGERFDTVFCDIWHDPSDGVELYLRFKELETRGPEYIYWLEDTLKLYL